MLLAPRRRVHAPTTIVIATCLAIGALVALPSEASATVTPGALYVQAVDKSASDVPTLIKDTANGDTVTLGPAPTNAAGIRIATSAITLLVNPPGGQQLTAGADYDATYVGGSSTPVTALTGQPLYSFNCQHIATHIGEVDRDGTGAITGIAVSFR